MNIGVNERASAINQMYVGVDGVARLVYSSGGGGGDFQLPTFSGSSSIFGDATEGRIELYESGTLVLFPGNYDVFLVGGGGNGGGNNSGGAGGGHTTTISSVSIPDRTEIDIIVGAGGSASSFRSSGLSLNYTADAGSTATTFAGATGGSGGGGAGGSNSGDGGAGGSDGGNGSSGVSGGAGGAGQGSTTRMFGEDGATIYAGGGGGPGKYYSSASCGEGGLGGSGGGGRGGGENGTYHNYQAGASGTPNTGGGAGGTLGLAGYNTPASGGSGIVIIRWGTAPTLSDTFGDNSWENIVWACNNNAVPESWAVGDKKFLQVGSENIEVAIADKNHDDLPDGGKAALTFTMTGIMTTKRSMYNSSSEISSFYSTNMYSYLRDTVLPQFPEVVKNNVKTVIKRTARGNKSAAIRTDNMPIWLFSATECGLSDSYAATDEGTVYPYYQTTSNRQKGDAWWLRSPHTGADAVFCYVTSSGGLNYYSTGTISSGVSFGFCI